MAQYKLLTPGPLTTTDTVKNKMLEDRCTWDDEYKNLTQAIREKLLTIGMASAREYTVVLQQGSGSFVVESVLQTALSDEDHVLIISNGAYGERMIKMAQVMKKNVTPVCFPYNETPDVNVLKKILERDDSFTHIAFVHCETTTGILNPIEEICEMAIQKNLKVILDAMSSFGGVPINIPALDIDYLISSANKCIQGVPGFGFVIAKQTSLELCEGNATSVSLDLYDQWKSMNIDGKWRFTSPTHVVAAFRQAIRELEEEGGVERRYQRYRSNNTYIINEMKKIGFEPYVESAFQSPIITTFLYPNKTFEFQDFYKYMKERGFVLYPGKLMDKPSFRIGNIGDLHRTDFEILIKIIKEYQMMKGEEV
ncbi:2-aminoethylphosphonate--pyruvate transaminase [Staphylococcus succinus]|uniref:2-aminoethylphosphonate--pyruvate transaminase n=1 Tax=Staphylococcus succinus TaxID=61015 RepID=A0ABX5IMN2_9STAP|nr:2-aminoethylphosphonate--pyruvate transaminase [Staphylococcus succinus]PTI69137.1 2-aminoethylphosphonate--pyruvate transaminase [Staphylococcus succinus]RIN37104.1 2-aminoethylphosphonate--pyruvate transaminase [Staphylococcus succinus]